MSYNEYWANGPEERPAPVSGGDIADAWRDSHPDGEPAYKVEFVRVEKVRCPVCAKFPVLRCSICGGRGYTLIEPDYVAEAR